MRLSIMIKVQKRLYIAFVSLNNAISDIIINICYMINKFERKNNMALKLATQYQSNNVIYDIIFNTFSIYIY